LGPSTSRGATWRRIALALVALAALGALAYVVGLTAYGFFAGADEYLAGTPKATSCETPGSRFGWDYEAINYDIADDTRLLAENPDPTNCADQGSAAGNEVVASDGVRIAGWFIPAASEHDSKEPIVVLVHGGKSNKSAMLDYAPAFHDDLDIVIVDLRNSGRSGDASSTGGLHEQQDLRAMLDWLSEEKSLFTALLVGNSNGAAATLAEAWNDHRVAAVILDSMHAQVERQIGNVIETERGLPAWPGAWALVAGVSAKVGVPLGSVDPVVSLRKWDGRPIMFTHGSADVVDRPSDSLELNVAEAEYSGLQYEVQVCQGAGHGKVIVVCADRWAAWAQGFVEKSFTYPR
jgi:pimeloyl-ACP methyl ester carboxylesterase